MADISRSIKTPNKGSDVVSKTASWTVKPQDGNKTFLFDSTTRIIATLPKITKQNDGLKFRFVVKQLDGGATGHTITPQSADTILHAAAAGAATAGQSMIAAVAGDQIGQSTTLVADYGSLCWVPESTFGTWTKA